MLRITGNNILIVPLPAKVKSPAGIHLPEDPTWAYDNLQFRVLAVGPGRTVRKKGKPDVQIPIELEPGDKVLFALSPGAKETLENGMMIVDANEVIAKFGMKS